jgi:hypothetical protein
MCIHIFTHMYMYLYVYIYGFGYIHTYLSIISNRGIYIHIYVYIHKYIIVYICIYIHLSMVSDTYIFISILLYIHTHLSMQTYIATGHTLDVATALTSLALFEIIRFPLIMLPNVLNNVVEATVSIDRVQVNIRICTYLYIQMH